MTLMSMKDRATMANKSNKRSNSYQLPLTQLQLPLTMKKMPLKRLQSNLKKRLKRRLKKLPLIIMTTVILDRTNSSQVHQLQRPNQLKLKTMQAVR